MSSRSQLNNLPDLKQQLKLLEQTQEKLSNTQSELQSIELKKQRALEDLESFSADITAKKKKLEREFDRERTGYELEIASYPDVLHDLTINCENIEDSIKMAIEELEAIQGKIIESADEVDSLDGIASSMKSSIKVSEDELYNIEVKVSEAKGDLIQLNNQIAVSHNIKSKLDDDILIAQEELANLRDDLQTRKDTIEDEMKITIQKSSDITQRLIALQNRESEINKSIAARSHAIELREQVVTRKEAKLYELESKAQQYAKFMKL